MKTFEEFLIESKFPPAGRGWGNPGSIAIKLGGEKVDSTTGSIFDTDKVKWDEVKSALGAAGFVPAKRKGKDTEIMANAKVWVAFWPDNDRIYFTTLKGRDSDIIPI